VKALRTALKKLRPSSEILTPIHVDFLQVCLLAKCYSIALPILQDEIFEPTSEVASATSKDVLLYFYYGGLVLTGAKEFKKALGFFKIVVTHPATTLSAIMVEAYKKFLLISLIVNGKVFIYYSN
jgi:COP9 signalosome complex subunit 3